jgi:hypothetical protein
MESGLGTRIKAVVEVVKERRKRRCSAASQGK